MQRDAEIYLLKQEIAWERSRVSILSCTLVTLKDKNLLLLDPLINQDYVPLASR